MKKYFFIFLLLIMAISIVGCAQNTFLIETNDRYVLPNKVHYKQNERAKITILKTKESDIIEPIALVEFRNTNNKVVEKIENFSSLESNNNELRKLSFYSLYKK